MRKRLAAFFMKSGEKWFSHTLLGSRERLTASEKQASED